jgi:hypothetical protein
VSKGSQDPLDADVRERRRFVVAALVYVFMEIAKRDPRADPLDRGDDTRPIRVATLDRIDDALFLPRVVDGLRGYLGDGFFGEIEEGMVLSDFHDEETAGREAERIQGQVFALITDIFASQDPRALIHDWLLETQR